MKLFAALPALIALPCLADVTVHVTSYNASSGEFGLTVSGDSVGVLLEVQGPNNFDWCKPGGELGTTATPTDPDLGVPNNDGILLRSTTVVGPLTTICDIDPNVSWPGVNGTVNGVTKPLPVGTMVLFQTQAPPSPPAGADYSATLTWQAPVTNTDGSPLNDLTGFRVYWSQTTTPPFPNSQSVGVVTSYTVTGLAAGLWYFAVTAVSPNGESAYSNIASKTFADPPPADPCVSDPFLAPTNLAWPTSRSGSRSLRWDTPRSVVRIDYSWPFGQGQSATWTDDRGCTVTVNR